MSKHNYPTVLVHGLLGIDEGKYNYLNYVYRYFGGFRGDLTKAMRAKGYEFYDPGLGPFTPVWDRVCDLYAYLVGGTVDYGKAHSERYGHARYGRTYEGVLKDWGTPGDHEKINILGYSFGGPTVNLLNGLLMHGSEEERAVTPEDELSPLFTGGKGDLLHCVCTLDGTNNGTKAIDFLGRKTVDLFQMALNGLIISVGDTAFIKVLDFKMDQLGLHNDPDHLGGKLRLPKEKHAENLKNVKSDENMFWQMGTEYAKHLAEKYYDVNPSTYYLCYRSVRTHEDKNKNYKPNVNMNPMMVPTGAMLGVYAPEPNDGIVHLEGQSAPLNLPCAGDFRVADETKPGIWYHMPIIDGDHLTWCGMFINKRAYQNRFQAIIDLCNDLD